ncbi:DUF4342 domain-containing protein [Desulfitobacterium sp. Sab5]|uniref:DUF4342 domain-containing protein n=1 Tax=Desulfitobacterium nosdiversum TaxID=3375356 RepID=UPI003CED52CD
MAITMEQIDEMRKRTNCSYEEAKELLEKHNGDLLEAIVDFEKKHGYQSRHESYQKPHKLGRRIKELIQKGFRIRVIIEKDKNVILNIPLNILIIAILVTMPFFWLYLIGFVAIYLMGYKIRLRKEEGLEVNIDEIVNGIGSKVRTAAEKMREQPVEKEQNHNQSAAAAKSEEKKEDGYNEITVE